MKWIARSEVASRPKTRTCDAKDARVVIGQSSGVWRSVGKVTASRFGKDLLGELLPYSSLSRSYGRRDQATRTEGTD